MDAAGDSVAVADDSVPFEVGAAVVDSEDAFEVWVAADDSVPVGDWMDAAGLRPASPDGSGPEGCVPDGAVPDGAGLDDVGSDVADTEPDGGSAV